MRFQIRRDDILKPLQQVAGIVEKRQTLAVLSNVLMVVKKGSLSLTGTDMEIELIVNTSISSDVEEGEITVPARKLFDICKSLPHDADLEIISEEGGRLILKSGRSRFSLITLPASDFPNIDEHSGATSKFDIGAKELKQLIESTSFAMAQQDVRYYLNGMLFELSENNQLKTVATDGHRLALSSVEIQNIGDKNSKTQAIVPRKGVLELARLFGDVDEKIAFTIGNNYIQVTTKNLSFSSKLVDGKFPDYDRVIPKGGDRRITINREDLRQALSRVAILSNDKFRGVRLLLSSNSVQLLANNPEQEEAEENVVAAYQGADMEIGFNVNYLLDVMNTLRSEKIELLLTDSNSSGVIQGEGQPESLYVVMPMRL